MDKSTTREVSLEFPLQLADRKLDKIFMRRPVMRDMLKHKIGPRSGLQEDINLIADLCGLCPEDIEGLDTVDYEKLQDQLFRFRGMA